MIELYDGAGARMGLVYCPPTNNVAGVTPDFILGNERNGSFKFVVNGNDRFGIFSNGGAYLGNANFYDAATNPGASNLKVAGTIEAESGLIYTPTTLANWTSGADPGMVKDALDQLASRTKTLETTGGGGGGEYAILTADNFVDSIGTLAAVPGMSFSIAGGEAVTAIFSGYWATGGSNYGFKYDFTGPSSPTFVTYSEYAFTALAAVRTIGTSVAAFETLKEQGAATIGSYFPITIQITVIASSGNGGTVTLRMAGESSNASFNLLRGFTMHVMRV
jgi:hypothetical protein